MSKFVLKDIECLYGFVKNKATRYYINSNYEKSLEYISLSAIVAYNFNNIYTDPDTENLLKSISKRLSCRTTTTTTTSDAKRIVLIDTFANSKVLIVQYIRAIISFDVDFLFIAQVQSEEMYPYYQEIENSSKGQVCYIKSNTYTEKSVELCKVIDLFNPTHILTHIEPWETSSLVALAMFEDVKRYNINLTDHTFSLGASIFDYVLEFRNFGAKLTKEKREFKNHQILVNPYYPLFKDNTFQGFPAIVKGKVVIFSGSAYYKIYGDNNKFLYIMKNILEQNPSSVILFAGMGTEKNILVSFIDKYNLKDRLILLGERKDIDRVFENCDIYLGTYPSMGGLMSMYAGSYAKPIISYTKNLQSGELPEDLIFINSHKEVTCSFDDTDKLLAEAKKLVDDKEYRENQGRLLKQYTPTEISFTNDLKQNLFNPKSKQVGDSISINYDAIINKYLEIYNERANMHLDILLFKMMKFNILKLQFKFVCRIVFTVISLLPNHIKKRYIKNYRNNSVI